MHFCLFLCYFSQKAFIFYDFLKTAKNNFIKMNGFGGFWIKVDENVWVLSKNKMATKKHKRHKKREFRIQNSESRREAKKRKYRNLTTDFSDCTD